MGFRSTDPWAWQSLGEALCRVDRPDEAQWALEHGLGLHPTSVEIAYVLGQALLDQDKRTEANELFAQLTREHPASPFGFLGLASVASALGDSKATLAWAQEADQKRSGDPRLALSLGSILVEVPEAADLAEALLAEAATAYSREPLPRLLLGVLIDGRDPARSQVLITQARRSWPRHKDFDEHLRYVQGRLSRSGQ